MKYIYQLTILAAFVLLFAGCEDTNEDLVGLRNIAAVPNVTEISPDTYSLSLEDLLTETISFKVNLGEGVIVDNAKIEVRYKDKTGILKEIPSFPADVTITGAEMLQCLSIDESAASLGTSFYIYVLTTSGDVTTRSQTATVIMSLPCEFVPSFAVGSYKVVAADWGIDAAVDMVADPEDPNKIHIKGLAKADDGMTSNGNDMIITIDRNTFDITGDKVTLADDCSAWGADYAGYTNYSLKVKSGKFDSCSGDYEIVFEITVDQGSFGAFSYVFTKS